MDAGTGQILLAENPDRTWDPASVTKLILLLLADEAIGEGRLSLADTIVATRRAQKQGGSQVYLAAGEGVPFIKLLEAVAVGSANDAAFAVAVALYGSGDAAVEAMNIRARALGMRNTHYVNVTGLPERTPNVTTARDQARLAREIVLMHKGVLEWTKLKYTRFRPGLDVACTNAMVKRYKGCDGLKTGYHHRARCNIVTTAERNGRRLIAVVFGSSSPRRRNALAARLLDRGFSEWEEVLAMRAGEDFGEEFSVAHSWNATIPVEATAKLCFLVRSSEASRVTVVLSDDARLEAPLRKGEILGEIQVVLDGRVLASVPARAGRKVSRAWFDLPGGDKQPQRPIFSAGMTGN